VDKTTSEVTTLDQRAMVAAKDNDEAERLIKEFQPYLHGQVRHYVGSDTRNEDELYSYAMTAFYEAIASYDIDKGHFFSFAKKVVSLRLIDCMRKIYRTQKNTVSLESDEAPNVNMIQESIVQYQAEQEQKAIAEEIRQFCNEMENWNITMDMLVKHSPRHKALRKEYRRVAKEVAGNQDIMQTLQLKMYFPISKVSEITGVPQKKLERGRIYIIASIIIHSGDYEYLADYIRDED